MARKTRAIDRRAFLSAAAAAAVLPSCTLENGEDEMSRSLPPWHLWGTTTTLDISGSVVNGQLQVTQSQQLARIDYGRPETWSFFLQTKLLRIVGNLATPFSVQWYLNLGIGRANAQIGSVAGYPFAEFTYQVSGVGTGGYTTQIQTPGTSFGEFTPQFPQPNGGTVGVQIVSTPTVVDKFPAQSIQCNGAGFFLAQNTGCVVTVEMTAMFAPLSHIRPEWFERSFPGGENNGR